MFGKIVRSLNTVFKSVYYHRNTDGCDQAFSLKGGSNEDLLLIFGYNNLCDVISKMS